MTIKVRSLGLGTGLVSLSSNQIDDETLNAKEANQKAMEYLEAAADLFEAMDFADKFDMVCQLLDRIALNEG